MKYIICLLMFIFNTIDATNLHNAVYKNNVQTVQALLNHGANPNQQDHHGATPLHYAVTFNPDITITWLLITAQATTNAKTKIGATPLHLAADNKVAGKQHAELLLQAGACLNAKTFRESNQQTPLHCAVYKKNQHLIELLLTKRADKETDSEGQTPLHYAARINNIDALPLLLQDKRLTNVQDAKGMSSLHWAAHHGFTDFAQKLIDSGANVNIQNACGETPFLLAVANQAQETINLLMTVKETNINQATKDGITPLHYAAYHGNSTLTKKLCEAGAHPNAQDMCYTIPKTGGIPFQPNATPLHYAVHYATIDDEIYRVIRILLYHGADVNKQDINGDTACHKALYHNNAAIVSLMLQAGVDVTLQDNNGTSILSIIQKLSRHQKNVSSLELMVWRKINLLYIAEEIGTALQKIMPFFEVILPVNNVKPSRSFLYEPLSSHSPTHQPQIPEAIARLGSQKQLLELLASTLGIFFLSFIGYSLVNAPFLSSILKPQYTPRKLGLNQPHNIAHHGTINTTITKQ